MENGMAIWLPIVVIIGIVAIITPIIIWARKWEKKQDVTCTGCGKIFQRQYTKISRRGQSGITGSTYSSDNNFGTFHGVSNNIEFYCFPCYDMRKQPNPPANQPTTK